RLRLLGLLPARARAGRPFSDQDLTRLSVRLQRRVELHFASRGLAPFAGIFSHRPIAPHRWHDWLVAWRHVGHAPNRWRWGVAMSICSRLLQVAIVAGAAMLASSSAGVAQENACAAQDQRQA